MFQQIGIEVIEAFMNTFRFSALCLATIAGIVLPILFVAIVCAVIVASVKFYCERHHGK